MLSNARAICTEVMYSSLYLILLMTSRWSNVAWSHVARQHPEVAGNRVLVFCKTWLDFLSMGDIPWNLFTSLSAECWKFHRVALLWAKYTATCKISHNTGMPRWLQFSQHSNQIQHLLRTTQQHGFLRLPGHASLEFVYEKSIYDAHERPVFLLLTPEKGALSFPSTHCIFIK